jgi:hypothetical protein
LGDGEATVGVRKIKHSALRPSLVYIMKHL